MTHHPDLTQLDIAALNQGYAAGAFSPVDVAEQVLAAAIHVAAETNAITFTEPATTLAQARESAGRWADGTHLGPLDGVPVTVKDSLAVAGWPSTRGSRVTPHPEPERHDEPAVARLREAGTVLVGKTAMPEYAWCAVSDSPLHGVVRNARDRERTAGGSSGGAAVAVARGLGAIALGSDGGGSIRIPAAFNGVVGLKATYGRISAIPSGPFGRLAHIGPLTRTVADAAIALDVLVGPDPRDPDALAPASVDYAGLVAEAGQHWPGLRIGYSPDLGHADVTPDVAQVFADVVEALAGVGASIERSGVGWPDLSQQMGDVWAGVIAAGLIQLSEDEFSLLSRPLQEVISRGRDLSAVDYLTTFTVASETVGLELARFHTEFDVLLTPTLPLTAFTAGRLHPAQENEDDLREWVSWNPFTYPFNLTGQPAMSVPIGTGTDGLPIGVQVVARRGRDQDVLVVARAIEALVSQVA